MPLWGNTDTTGNSTIYAPAQFGKAPNTANRDALYGNTTAGAFVTGATIGQYGVDTNEERGLRIDRLPKPAHAGWALRTEGSGGRAGRVKYETLVAMHSLGGDASDDTILKDYAIVIDTNPSDASANADADEIATFTALGHAVPSQSVTYKWQKYTASWANVDNGGAYSNTATAELSVLANTAANGETYRCGLYSTGATTKYTSNAVLTITTA